MSLTIPKPNEAALKAANHPKQIEPIFSTRQAETVQSGQTLTVSCHFPDGSFDAESARLGEVTAYPAPPSSSSS
jgi:hypothetical protein